LQLFHPVQSTSGLKPFDLSFVERVVQLQFLDPSIHVLDDARQRLATGEQWRVTTERTKQ